MWLSGAVSPPVILLESCNIDSSTTVYDGHSGNPDNVYLNPTVNHMTIRNSTLSYSGNGNGIYIDGADNVLMEHDTAMYNAHDGFRIAFGWAPYLDGTDNLIVRYCVSRFNGLVGGGYALENDGAVNSSFYYNLLENNTSGWSTSLYIYNANIPPAYCYYYNNTIITHGNGNMAVQIDYDATIQNITFKNNIFYNTGTSSYVFWVNGGTPAAWTFTNNLY